MLEALSACTFAPLDCLLHPLGSCAALQPADHLHTALLLPQVILTVRDPATWYDSVKETVWAISRVSAQAASSL